MFEKIYFFKKPIYLNDHHYNAINACTFDLLKFDWITHVYVFFALCLIISIVLSRMFLINTVFFYRDIYLSIHFRNFNYNHCNNLCKTDILETTVVS